MKKKLTILSACILLTFSSCNEHSTEAMVPAPASKVDVASLSGRQVQAGQLIVKFKGEPSSVDVFTRSGIRIRKMERVFPHAGEFEERSRAAGLHLWYVVDYDKEMPITRAAEEISLLDDVLCIEPVIPVKRNGTGKFRRLQENDAAAFKAMTGNSAFNDPYTYGQWNYQNTGRINHSIEGADIRLFDAWKQSTGHPDVIVAVVDGGIDYAHEDLSANMWVNAAERSGIEGTDDDGNGYRDDIYGFNFVTGRGLEATLHGTHVAGTIGAVNNNGLGVSGIAGGNGASNSGVRLMSCQVFLDNAEGEKSATNYFTAAAIKYGADNGAVICQNSWGFDLGTVIATPRVIQEAIAYFIANAGMDKSGNQVGPMKGGLVVFAAGNDNVGIPTFPASDDQVISVAAMAPDYRRATYSNYGSTIDIMAPGGDISYDQNKARTGVLSTGGGWDGSSVVSNAYYYMDGTSMACPHVSGVAALLVSKYGVGQPGLTPDRVKELLYASVYDVSAYNPGYQGKLGAGALDASRALGAGEVQPPAPPVLLRSLPDVTFNKVGDLRIVALNDYFAPAETGEELTFSASATSEIVWVELTGNVLKLSSTGYGKSDITVTALASNGLETASAFAVSCHSRTMIPGKERPGFWNGVSDIETP